ncbi:MAG: hypothetical protein HOM96_00790 [Rickettsiales bacterium]|nr:hypothetical protein [Rickettsiales bacterium]
MSRDGRPPKPQITNFPISHKRFQDFDSDKPKHSAFMAAFIEKYSPMFFLLDDEITDQALLRQFKGTAAEGEEIRAEDLTGLDYITYLETLKQNTTIIQEILGDFNKNLPTTPYTSPWDSNPSTSNLKAIYNSVKNKQPPIQRPIQYSDIPTGSLNNLENNSTGKSCIAFINQCLELRNTVITPKRNALLEKAKLLTTPVEVKTEQTRINNLFDQLESDFLTLAVNNTFKASDTVKRQDDLASSRQISETFVDYGLLRIAELQKTLEPYMMKRSTEFPKFIGGKHAAIMLDQSYSLYEVGSIEAQQNRFLYKVRDRATGSGKGKDKTKPINFNAPAGSGKTHICKQINKIPGLKVKGVLFVTSVRTDLDPNNADFPKISYEDFLAEQSHEAIGTYDIIIFDEFESQSDDIKKKVKEKDVQYKKEKTGKVNIHLSATPNLYESLLKTERTILKAKSAQSDTGSGRPKTSAANRLHKHNAYQNDYDILNAKRNDILQNVVENIGTVKDPPENLGESPGFHYFYKSVVPAGATSQEAPSQQPPPNIDFEKLMGFYPGQKVIIAYIDNENTKQVKIYEKGNDVATDQTFEAYSAGEDFRNDFKAEAKFICCYDISKKDHIGVDFGNLSKATTCDQRVIDANISDLTINDWVQLYGRVRSVSLDAESTIATSNLPLRFLSGPGINKEKFQAEMKKQKSAEIDKQINDIKDNKTLDKSAIKGIADTCFNLTQGKENNIQNTQKISNYLKNIIGTPTNFNTSSLAANTTKDKVHSDITNYIFKKLIGNEYNQVSDIKAFLEKYGCGFDKNGQLIKIPSNVKMTELISDIVLNNETFLNNVIKGIGTIDEMLTGPHNPKHDFYQLQIRKLQIAKAQIKDPNLVAPEISEASDSLEAAVVVAKSFVQETITTHKASATTGTSSATTAPTIPTFAKFEGKISFETLLIIIETQKSNLSSLSERLDVAGMEKLNTVLSQVAQVSGNKDIMGLITQVAAPTLKGFIASYSSKPVTQNAIEFLSGLDQDQAKAFVENITLFDTENISRFEGLIKTSITIDGIITAANKAKEEEKTIDYYTTIISEIEIQNNTFVTSKDDPAFMQGLVDNMNKHFGESLTKFTLAKKTLVEEREAAEKEAKRVAEENAAQQKQQQANQQRQQQEAQQAKDQEAQQRQQESLLKQQAEEEEKQNEANNKALISAFSPTGKPPTTFDQTNLQTAGIDSVIVRNLFPAASNEPQSSNDSGNDSDNSTNSIASISELDLSNYGSTYQRLIVGCEELVREYKGLAQQPAQDVASSSSSGDQQPKARKEQIRDYLTAFSKALADQGYSNHDVTVFQKELTAYDITLDLQDQLVKAEQGLVSTNEVYKEQQGILTKQIEKQKQSLKAKDVEITAKDEELSRLRLEIETVKIEHQSGVRLTKEQSAKILNLDARIEEVSQQQVIDLAVKTQLNDEIDQLKAANQKLVVDHAAEIKALNEENTLVKSQLEILQASNELFEAQNKKINELNQTQLDSLNELQAELEAKKETITEQEAKLLQQDQQLQSLRNQVEAIKSKITTANDQQIAANNEVIELKAKLKTLGEKESKTEAASEVISKENTRLQAGLAAALKVAEENELATVEAVNKLAEQELASSKQLHIQTDEFRATKSELKTANEDLTKQITALKQAQTDLELAHKTQIAQLKLEHAEALEQQAASFQTAKDELVKQLQAEKVANEALARELQEAKTNVNQLTTQLEERVLEVGQTTEQNELIRTALEQAQEKVNKLEFSLREQQTTHEEALLEMQAQHILDYQIYTEGREAEFNQEFEAQRKQFYLDYTALQARNEELTQQIVALEERNKVLTSENEELKKQNQELEQSVVVKNNQITANEAEITALKLAQTTLQGRIAELDASGKNQTEEITQLQTQLDQNQSDITAKTKENTQLTKQLDELKQLQEELKQKNQALEKENTEQKDQIAQQGVQITAQKEAFETQGAHIAEQESAYEKAKAELEKTNKGLKVDINNKDQEVKALESELAAIANQISLGVSDEKATAATAGPAGGITSQITQLQQAKEKAESGLSALKAEQNITKLVFETHLEIAEVKIKAANEAQEQSEEELAQQKLAFAEQKAQLEADKNSALANLVQVNAAAIDGLKSQHTTQLNILKQRNVDLTANFAAQGKELEEAKNQISQEGTLSAENKFIEEVIGLRIQKANILNGRAQYDEKISKEDKQQIEDLIIIEKALFKSLPSGSRKSKADFKKIINDKSKEILGAIALKYENEQYLAELRKKTEQIEEQEIKIVRLEQEISAANVISAKVEDTLSERDASEKKIIGLRKKLESEKSMNIALKEQQSLDKEESNVFSSAYNDKILGLEKINEVSSGVIRELRLQNNNSNAVLVKKEEELVEAREQLTAQQLESGNTIATQGQELEEAKNQLTTQKVESGNTIATQKKALEEVTKQAATQQEQLNAQVARITELETLMGQHNELSERQAVFGQRIANRQIDEATAINKEELRNELVDLGFKHNLVRAELAEVKSLLDKERRNFVEEKSLLNDTYVLNISELQVKIKANEEVIKRIKAEAEGQSGYVSALEEKNVVLTAALAAKTSEFKALEARLAPLEEQLQTIQASNQVLEEQNGLLGREVEAGKANILRLNREKGNLRNKIEKEQSSIRKEDTGKIAQLRTQLEEEQRKSKEQLESAGEQIANREVGIKEAQIFAKIETARANNNFADLDASERKLRAKDQELEGLREQQKEYKQDQLKQVKGTGAAVNEELINQLKETIQLQQEYAQRSEIARQQFTEFFQQQQQGNQQALQQQREANDKLIAEMQGKVNAAQEEASRAHQAVEIAGVQIAELQLQNNQEQRKHDVTMQSNQIKADAVAATRNTAGQLDILAKQQELQKGQIDEQKRQDAERVSARAAEAKAIEDAKVADHGRQETLQAQRVADQKDQEDREALVRADEKEEAQEKEDEGEFKKFNAQIIKKSQEYKKLFDPLDNISGLDTKTLKAIYNGVQRERGDLLQIENVEGFKKLQEALKFFEGDLNDIDDIDVPFDAIDRDRQHNSSGRVNRSEEIIVKAQNKINEEFGKLKFDEVKLAATKALYLKGINIDNDVSKYLEVLSKKMDKDNPDRDEILNSLEKIVKTSLATSNNKDKSLEKIATIIDNADESFSDFAIRNYSALAAGDEDNIEQYFKTVIDHASDGRDLIAFMKKIKSNEVLSTFIDDIDSNNKTDMLIAADPKARFLTRLLTKRNLDEETAKELISNYCEDDEIKERLEKKCERVEGLEDKLDALGFDFSDEYNQSKDEIENEEVIEPKSKKEVKNDNEDQISTTSSVVKGSVAGGVAFVVVAAFALPVVGGILGGIAIALGTAIASFTRDKVINSGREDKAIKSKEYSQVSNDIQEQLLERKTERNDISNRKDWGKSVRDQEANSKGNQNSRHPQ